MEGLAEDADLLFLLTTNRADLIEPALAARPGLVDLALEIPLPDEAARAELIRLYAGEVPLDELLEERSTLTRRLLGQASGDQNPSLPAPAVFPVMLHSLGAFGISTPSEDE